MGLGSNILIGAAKAFAGIVGNSQALLADAVHHLTDCVSDVVTMLTLKMTRGEVQDNLKYPYGRGRLETIGALVVSGLLFATGLGLAFHTFEHLINPSYHQVPGMIAFYIAIGSMVIKELMFQMTIRIAKKNNSSVMLANAWHHRSDAMSSAVALAGIVGARLALPLLDPLAGLILSGMIMKTGWSLTAENLRELLDQQLDPAVLQKISEIVKSVEGVRDAHNIRGRKMGSEVLIDLHLEVSKRMSVSAAHHLSEIARLRILSELPQISEVMVHVDTESEVNHATTAGGRSQGMSLKTPSEIEAQVATLLPSLVKEVKGADGVTCHYLNGRLFLEVNLLLDKTLSLSSAEEIARRTRVALENNIEGVQHVSVNLKLDATYPCERLSDLVLGEKKPSPPDSPQSSEIKNS